MTVRFFCLSAPDLFKVLATAVDTAIKKKIDDGVMIGPFDDRMIIEHGVWLSGDDTAIAKLVGAMEKELVKKQVLYVWSVESVAPQG